MRVYIPDADTPIVIDSDVAMVDDRGSLVIFADADATRTVAGFAPGAWSAFSMGDEVMRLGSHSDQIVEHPGV